jgi:large subunit ribosomal protein L4
MPTKMRRAALRSALSAKAADAGLVLVDELVLDEPKTRLMVEALNALVGEASALVVAAEKDANYDMVMRSTRNIPATKLLLASYLNIRDILRYDKLVLPLKALDVLKSHLVQEAA